MEGGGSVSSVRSRSHVKSDLVRLRWEFCVRILFLPRGRFGENWENGGQGGSM